MTQQQLSKRWAVQSELPLLVSVSYDIFNTSSLCPSSSSVFSLLLVDSYVETNKLIDANTSFERCLMILHPDQKELSAEYHVEFNAHRIDFHASMALLEEEMTIWNKIQDNISSLPIVHATVEISEQWKILITYLMQYANDSQLTARKKTQTLLKLLLIDIEHLTSLSIDNSRNQMRIKNFKELILRYGVQEKLPSFYAEKLNITTNYLNKLCVETYGMTAGEIIRQQIVKQAEHLLTLRHLSIKEVAVQLGFENTGYFPVFFRRQTGLSPEQYRKQHTNHSS
jgi:AraC-like DNA-binding protein